MGVLELDAIMKEHAGFLETKATGEILSDDAGLEKDNESEKTASENASGNGQRSSQSDNGDASDHDAKSSGHRSSQYGNGSESSEGWSSNSEFSVYSWSEPMKRHPS